MKITLVKALAGHVLQLAFSDGTTGSAPMREMIDSFRPFAPLRDEALFRQVFIEGGTAAWPNGLDCAIERLYALAHGLPSPDTLEQAEANELAMSLRELRRMGGTLQEDVARTLDVTQGAVSKLEAGAADAKLGTLRRYLSALGWDLEVVATQGDKRVRLRGV